MNGNNNADNFECNSVVCDYIRYRLQRANHEWPTCPDIPQVTSTHTTMRSIADEFEERYVQVFDNMSQQLEITPDTVQGAFCGIVNELFDQGIKWGRIVALFAFAGNICVQCVNQGDAGLVDNIATWTTSYIQTNLSQWIIENGGWAEFVSHFSNTENRMRCPWRPSTSQMIKGAAITAIGATILGAIYAHKST